MNVRGSFGRFCVVGAIGFLVDVGVLYALSNSLGWYAARVVSFFCAATATWALNRRHTFAANASTQAPGMLREYLTWLASMLGGGVVNYLTYLLLLQWQAFGPMPALGVALGSVAGLAVNYLLARHVVFKPGRHR